MKTTPKVNKLAQILQIYGALNAAAGAGIAVMLWTSGELEFAAAFAQFAETLVSSFLVIAVGVIIQLLYMIYLNSGIVDHNVEELPEV